MGRVLHQAANSTHYVVLLSGDTGGPGAGHEGEVWVGPTAATSVNYDAQGTGGCNAVK